MGGQTLRQLAMGRHYYRSPAVLWPRGIGRLAAFQV